MTSGGGGLINLGDISKPATVLIEKVSDAVGGIAKPWQIKRVAKAEAEAELIGAEARLEISHMERRALERMVREEGKRQENIEQITAGAIPHLTDDAKPEELEEDWLAHFFDRSRLVSDQEMQLLWSKILARKANSPSSFSKKSIDLVSSIEKSDAEAFSKFCSLVWIIGDETPIMFDTDHAVIRDAEISFSLLTHLDDIGLVSFNPITGFSRTAVTDYAEVFYFGTPLHLGLRKEGDKYKLPTGKVLLTQVGKQLSSISGASRSEKYFNYVVEQWIEKGISVAMPMR